MEISNIANNPVEFILSNKTYKVKRLSLLDLYGSFESEVKTEYMELIQNYCKTVKDIKERIQLQKELIQDMPSGSTLQTKVSEKMSTFEGGKKILVMALSKCQQITDDEINTILLDQDNSITISNLMDFISGNDNKKVVNEVKLDTEKKTITVPETIVEMEQKA